MLLERVPVDRSGTGKASEVVRTKAYLKPGEPIDQYTPVQDVASRMLGCTWKAACNVAMIDTVGCNMACWYCYQAGRSTETIELAPGEIAREFMVHAMGSPVWRVSGGEPLLQPDVFDLLDALETVGKDEHLIWLNTNGLALTTGSGDIYLDIDRLGCLMCHDNVVVEVSLKGFDNAMASRNTGLPDGARVLDRQLLVIDAMTRLGIPLMLNVVAAEPQPNHDGPHADPLVLVRRLAEINPTLPYRTTPVRVKRYDWCPEWPANWVSLADDWTAAVDFWSRTEADAPDTWIDRISPPASFLGLRSLDR